MWCLYFQCRGSRIGEVRGEFCQMHCATALTVEVMVIQYVILTMACGHGACW